MQKGIVPVNVLVVHTSDCTSNNQYHIAHEKITSIYCTMKMTKMARLIESFGDHDALRALVVKRRGPLKVRNPLNNDVRHTALTYSAHYSSIR